MFLFTVFETHQKGGEVMSSLQKHNNIIYINMSCKVLSHVSWQEIIF